VALEDCTTGASNTAVGSDAGKEITTGASNVAVGYQALNVNTTGSDNTAVGQNAGALITTGAKNVCIGRHAGDSVTTADGNTMIGENAGEGVTTGHSNVIIGQQAGAYQRNLTTGHTNVLLGNRVYPSAVDVTQEIVIGYNLVGQGQSTFTFGHQSNDSSITFGETTISAPSDERLKKDITTSTAGLGFINDLRPVTYKWKNKGDIPSDLNGYVEGSTEPYKNAFTEHGFVAQEVKTAIDAHTEIKDGFGMWKESPDGRQRIGDAALVPMLVKAIQELSAQNEALSARITTLEG